MIDVCWNEEVHKSKINAASAIVGKKISLGTHLSTKLMLMLQDFSKTKSNLKHQAKSWLKNFEKITTVEFLNLTVFIIKF